MLLPYRLQMRCQIGLDGLRQHRGAVLVALAAPHGDLVPAEIDVLDAQPAALEQPQPGSVEKHQHQPRRARRARENRANLAAGKHDRNARGCLRSNEIVEPRQLLTEHVSVEEQDRRQRLVLRRGRDAIARRQGAEKCRHLLGAKCGGVSAARELVEPDHPAEVGLLGTRAEPAQAHRLARAVAGTGSRPTGRSAIRRSRPARHHRNASRDRMGVLARSLDGGPN